MEPNRLGTVVIAGFQGYRIPFVFDGHPCHGWYNLSVGQRGWEQLEDPVVVHEGWVDCRFN